MHGALQEYTAVCDRTTHVQPFPKYSYTPLHLHTADSARKSSYDQNRSKTGQIFWIHNPGLALYIYMRQFSSDRAYSLSLLRIIVLYSDFFFREYTYACSCVMCHLLSLDTCYFFLFDTFHFPTKYLFCEKVLLCIFFELNSMSLFNTIIYTVF